MIDPLTAFGLAANIIQFLELGGQIVQTGYRTYHTGKGATEENIRLEQITSDLIKVTETLTIPLAAEDASLSRPDADLERLGRQCQELARRLLKILDQLTIKSKGPSRGWRALQIAVKEHVTKKSEIQSISGSLNTYRQQISTHLLAIMRNNQSTVLKELRELQDSAQKLQASSLNEIRSMKKELIDVLSAHSDLLGRFRNWETVTADEKAIERGLLETIVKKMDKMARTSSVLATELWILDSLYFSQMHMRQEAIKETFSDTFTWIFEDSTTDFRSWLENDSGIFWVRGKAGSGKSTLMKFLNNHPQTPDILQRWAGSKKLVTASYYFWSAGTPMQKSQRGLLQSLLFQLLSQCPDLIPVAVPRLWNLKTKELHSNRKNWERHELSEALDAILAKKELPTRFCFFVDGLDEYSGDYYDLTKDEEDARAETDHYELIRDLEKLACNPDVKLCLSSRPWNPFRKAFGNGKRKTLILEELTQADIEKYITGILEEDTRFVELAKEENRAGEVISEIREKAEGVFLWVFLAVRSLLRGLSEDDDIEELKRRIRKLPSDLKEFFRRILGSIDKEYQELTCRLLALTSYVAALPLRAFWHLRLEMDDPDYALKGKLEPIRATDAPELKAAASTSVNKWCRDLLEVKEFKRRSDVGYCAPDEFLDNSFITYPHRTVKDFLADSDIRKYIEERIGKDFDKALSMCRLELARAKSLALDLSTSANDRNRKRFRYLAHSIIHHARNYEVRNGTALTAIVDELGQNCHHLFGPNWIDSLEGERDLAGRLGPLDIKGQEQSNCLAYAVSHNLTCYVSGVLDRKPDAIRKSGRPLFRYVLDPRFHLGVEIFRLREQMIRVLLNAGADVNEPANFGGDASVWQVFLDECYHTRQRNMQGIAIAFLDYGADLDCRVPIRRPESSQVCIANLSGSRETEMDLEGSEMIGEEYATVVECLANVFSEEEASNMLADVRATRASSAPSPVPQRQSWISWVLPWRRA